MLATLNESFKEFKDASGIIVSIFLLVTAAFVFVVGYYCFDLICEGKEKVCRTLKKKIAH